MKNVWEVKIPTYRYCTNLLQFFFSNENADYYPKLWFFKPRATEFATTKEIQPSEDISMTLCHILNINNFSVYNIGVYTCKSYDKTSNDQTFTYVLDGKCY